MDDAACRRRGRRSRAVCTLHDKPKIARKELETVLWSKTKANGAVGTPSAGIGA